MKKLILTAVALCVGAIGFAQVTDGDGNNSPNATVIGALPGAGAGANTGLSVQNGNDNKVRVRQAGTSQSAYTVQDNGSGIGANQAYVRQTGSVQAASGVANAAETRQSGSENSSITRQEGDYNESVTRQGQNDDASARNKAYIQQGVANQAENNFAAIDQDGNDNQARTTQTYDNSDAWTQQVGNDNKSMIDQDAGPNQTDGHLASVQQEGNSNESAVNQSGNGARNTAYAVQLGDYNQAKQLQVTSALQGTGNRAGVLQGVGPGNRFVGLYANVVPTGDAIFTRINDEVDDRARPSFPTSLFSFYGKTKQVQYGFENEADITQAGGLADGASNYAEQVQAGSSSSGNAAGIRQAYQNAYGGFGSQYAKQYQAGDDNVAGVVQEGAENKSLQDQRGNNNTALSFQIGDSNLLNIHQRGDQSQANSTQWGIENAALIVQYDAQSYTVEQGVGDLSTFNNQADIMQLGPDGNFHDAAIDCDFEDPMNLDMDYSVPMLNLGDICPDC